MCPFCTPSSGENKALWGLVKSNEGIPQYIAGSQWYADNLLWDVFLIENARPILANPDDEEVRLPSWRGKGPFHAIDAQGKCDVILIGGRQDTNGSRNVEDKDGTPKRTLNNLHRPLAGRDGLGEKYIQLALYALVGRFHGTQVFNGTDLGKGIVRSDESIPGPAIKHVIVFSNYGQQAGSRWAHANWQVMGSPIIPSEIARELAHSKAYYEENSGRCCFCDMLAAEIERMTEEDPGRLIFPDSPEKAKAADFVVLAPFAARVPFELWILPRKHQASIVDIKETKPMDPLATAINEALGKLADRVNNPAYSLVIKNAPVAPKEQGDLYAHYHWRIVIEPQRLAIAAGYEHLTGIWSNPTPPEECAKWLRKKG